MRRISKEQAREVYSILVAECGARNDHREIASFVDYMANDDRFAKEWRFSGDLGFGGKCRQNSNHAIPHVDYYAEDETPARRAAAQRANERIAELFV